MVQRSSIMCSADMNGGAVGGSAAAASLTSSGPSVDSAGTSGGPRAAIAMCQQLGDETLKAPTTARYSDMVAYGEEPRWVVTGVVDAENSFGAPIREGVTCNLLHVEGTDRWEHKQASAGGRLPADQAERLAAEPFN